MLLFLSLFTWFRDQQKGSMKYLRGESKDKGLRAQHPKTYLKFAFLQKGKDAKYFICMLCHDKYKGTLQIEDFADSTTQDLGPLYERLRFFGL